MAKSRPVQFATVQGVAVQVRTDPPGFEKPVKAAEPEMGAACATDIAATDRPIAAIERDRIP